MTSHLSHAHQTTYDAILRVPSAHNLQWRDVMSMFGAIGAVVDEPGGSATVTRNGMTIVLHPHQTKDVGAEAEMKEIRQFLERSAEHAAPAAATAAEPTHCLVVIDHRAARIYRSELRGTVPERIVPYDPDGAGRHLHSVDDDSNGQRRPEPRGFYDAIARSLRSADEVLLFGSGTGSSSAMDQLVAALEHHHKGIAARIVGTVVIDAHHATEDQLLAHARAFYTDHAGRRHVIG